MEHSRLFVGPIHTNIVYNPEPPQKYLECLRSLFLTSPEDDLAAIRRSQGSRVEGTCEWILSQREYIDWLDGDNPQLLRLLGPPGIGKTIMSSFLVDELERKAQQTSSITLAYFFCDSKDEGRNNPTAILRGLLLQLLKKQPNLFKHIQSDYAMRGGSLFNHFFALSRNFYSILKDSDAGEIFVLIDALDECERSSRREFCYVLRSYFLRWQLEGSVNVKFLITHTSDFEIEETLNDVGRYLRINAGHINADLSRFIEVKVDELSRKKAYPHALSQDIKHALMSKATGNFLWASLVLDNISKTKTTFGVRRRLEALPLSLADLYERILLDIDHESRDDAIYVLRWVVGAQRPLTVDELAMALALRREEWDKSTIPPADVLDEFKDLFRCCERLVFLDPANRTIRLVHHSAKDFLLSERLSVNNHLSPYKVNLDETNLHFFETCLRYLRMDNFKSGPVNVDVPDSKLVNRKTVLQEYLHKNPFLEYAALQWPEHARATSSQLIATHQWECDFFGEDPRLLNAWMQIYWALSRPFEDSPGFTALHVAGFLGLEPLLNWLVEKRGSDSSFNVDKRDATDSTGLYWAARNGHEAVMKILIDKGANVNSMDRDGRTPLIGAATKGYDVVVRLLLDKGAAIDMEDKSGATALHLATRNGHKTVVELLVSSGKIAVDVKDNTDRTPLSWAAMYGHHSATRSLVQLQAKIDSKDDKYGRTPLFWAIVGGCEAARRKDSTNDLEDNGYAVNFDDEGQVDEDLDGSSHTDVVNILFEAGADINAQDKDMSTALHYATKLQHQDLQKFLIDLGADVNLRNAEKKSPAQLAWDRKRLDWSQYTVDEKTTANISQGANAKVAVLSKTGNYPDGPEVVSTQLEMCAPDFAKWLQRIFRKTITLPKKVPKKENRKANIIRSRIQSCLIREHDLLQKLDHPNIVSYLGYDENSDQGSYVLYLEFCNAGDLGQYEKLPPPAGADFSHLEGDSSSGEEDTILQESEVWSFVFHLAAALAYCHHGLSINKNSEFDFEIDWPCVLHRDIKPQNIALNLQNDGLRIPKLCDLGMSKALINDTQTSIAGTRLYVPPEKDWTIKSDIYSFGATFNNLDICTRSEELKSLFEHCMSKSPVQRPSSLKILQTAWQRINDDLKRAYQSLPRALGSNSPGFLLNAFTSIAARLDSENPFDSRITKERRKKLLKRLTLLCEDGADQLFDDYGESLHVAVLLGRDEKAQRLLKEGKEVNERWEASGWTPLHLAAQNDNFKVITTLLNFHADKTAEDKFGRLPYYYASKGGYQWSSTLLQDTEWAKRVFLDMSTTPLPRTDDSTKCFGEHMPNARAWLDDWEELLELEFGNSSGGLVVRLYLREEDNRARILCQWFGRSKKTRYSCLPLNTLEIHRKRSSLLLCRRILDINRVELWARLTFSTMERLVVFYCTLLALRSQDDGRPIQDIVDHELDGERECFAAEIIDDDFLHALRIYWDPDSKAVRLQASVLHGEMKRAPVWTAFITNYVRSPLWLTRAGPDIVRLSELRRHIFSNVYVPEQTRQGEHILKFTSDFDAEEFIRTIRDLARLDISRV